MEEKALSAVVFKSIINRSKSHMQHSVYVHNRQRTGAETHSKNSGLQAKAAQGNEKWGSKSK